MTTMTEERAQEPRRVIPRPASGIAIDPEQLIAWRARRAMSRQDLEDAIEALGWTDEHGRPVRYTRDAIAKSENGYRKPKPRTLKALCAALSTADDPCEPRDLLLDAPKIPLSPAARRRRARLDYNAAMRAYGEEHGIPFRDPDSRRVYYPRELQEQFAWHVLDTASRNTGMSIVQLAGDTVEIAREALRIAPGPAEDQADGGPAAPSRRNPDGLVPLAGQVPDPDAPVESLPLTTRVRNALRREGIGTIGQLAALSRPGLEDVRNLGERGRDEITAALAALQHREPAQLAS